MKRLIDANAAAALLGVRAGWLYKRAREGVVPHVRRGYWVRFDPVRLRAWRRRQPELQRRALRWALSAEQAAALLGRSVWWVYKQTSRGKAPHVKVGNEVRFLPRELREWASKQGLPPRRARGWARPSRAALSKARRAELSAAR